MHRADKAELRRRFAAARGERSSDDLNAARAAVRRHVLARCASERWSCVAAYVPLRTEPGSRELLADLVGAGVRVLVPVVLADRDLYWVDWGASHADDPMAAGPTDAPRVELAAADAVLVPAFAVAQSGTRLGRGGGSYDRALGGVSARAVVAALVFDDEMVDELPSDPWDRPVRAAVTPSGWVEVDGNADVGQDG